MAIEKSKKKKESTLEIEEEEVVQKEKAKETVHIEIGTTKKSLLEILDVVGCLVDEFAIKFDKNGAKINTVDPAHVSMIGMEIPKKYFTAYEYKSKTHEEYKLGLDLTKVKDFLKTLDLTDEIEIEYSDLVKTIVFKSGRMKRKMSELDSTGFSEPKVPDLNLPSTIHFTNDHLKQSLTAVEQVSDHIRIQTINKDLRLSGEGDNDQVEMVYGADDKVEIDGKEDVSSMFPLDYLMSFSKAIPTKANLVISMGSDYPCKIRFLIENNGAEVEVKYLLAPRIDADA
jgi:proliferating cell nuclear antigen